MPRTRPRFSLEKDYLGVVKKVRKRNGPTPNILAQEGRILKLLRKRKRTFYGTLKNIGNCNAELSSIL